MIGDRIARLRKENGYSAEQAAEKAGMPLKKYLNMNLHSHAALSRPMEMVSLTAVPFVCILSVRDL